MLYLLLNTMLSASLQGYIIGSTELIRLLICWSPTMSAVHVVLLFFLISFTFFHYIFDIFVLIVCFVYLNYLLYILTTILFVVLNILYFDRTDVTTNTFAQNSNKYDVLLFRCFHIYSLLYLEFHDHVTMCLCVHFVCRRYK
jgi:hypothetical protein